MYTHGGDIYKNKIDLDFSVNINPLPIHKDIIRAMQQAVSSVERYPEYDASSLKGKLSEILGVSEKNILITAGASEAFMVIAHGIMPKRTALFYPSFYGYEHAVNAAGSQIKRLDINSLYSAEGEELFADEDLAFVANPNNPTGKCIPKDVLFMLLNQAKEKNSILVVDECFLPLSSHSDESLIGEIATYDNLIVVRSFTKTFGIPGIRLGYLVANEKLAERLKSQLPEWNISNIAIAAGLKCLEHLELVTGAREYIKSEALHLTSGLKTLGFEVFDTDVNFILFKGPIDLKERLLERNILIRDCSNFYGLTPGFFRVAVRTKEENQKLLEALGQL